MKFLIIGNGGREDAIAWKLLQSTKVERVHILPRSVRKNPKLTSHDIEIDKHDDILKLSLKESIDIVIIGPEIPLCAGLSDLLRKNKIKVFGPSKKAAQLEGSKAFAKKMMKEFSIPTASSIETNDYNEAITYVQDFNKWPIVIKADGLASGKGVLIAREMGEAQDFLQKVLEEDVFNSGKKVVIEEFLDGVEFSLLAFVNRSGIFPLKVVRDYKKAYDGDKGLNTGGMGIITSLADITDEDIEYGVEKIVKPIIKGLSEKGIEYEGVLYAGLMKTKTGIYTIEFNVRFGDPETEGLMPIIENDLADIFDKMVNHKPITIRYNLKSCIGVVVAKEGYPSIYSKGATLNIPNNLKYFNMGISENNKGELISNGGRVILAYEVADTIQEARKNIYAKLKTLENNKEFFFRKDIGKEK
ncbi:phosphoribosylamine--glycine ligase [Mycoplasma todarodis]|uniref:Phosphoribosylamine--glycine ligase n=1 Tax=Mycoplasma todarodis TaxID=1937191 RepID=A0A4R0XKC7_9MOLU|nr:phosphoribosylamine--glycine ligase [Mycoplasma todarodis]TCG11093.1 phosphoribosylamine--glycine ligase [Mycoplasma todarodis]